MQSNQYSLGDKPQKGFLKKNESKSNTKGKNKNITLKILLIFCCTGISSFHNSEYHSVSNFLYSTTESLGSAVGSGFAGVIAGWRKAMGRPGIQIGVPEKGAKTIALTQAEIDEMSNQISERLASKMGIFQKTISAIMKHLAITSLNKLVEFCIQKIQDEGIVRGNRVKLEDLDTSKVKLILPKLIENKVNNIFTQMKTSIRNGTPMNNLLLSGPPGTGKTTLATQCCKEIEDDLRKNPVPGIDGTCYYLIRGAEWCRFETQKLLEVLKKCIDAWEQQAQNNIVIIIMDEIEVILPKRTETTEDKQEFINIFLSWTGQHKNRIILIGTTNLSDKLEDAMRRRFGQCVEISEPDIPARIQLLEQYSIFHLRENFPLVFGILNFNISKVFFTSLADKTDKFAGADFDNAVKKAVEEAVSTDGFLYALLLLKHINEEKHKKATFSKSNSEQKLDEINKVLDMDNFYGWIRALNPYVRITEIGYHYDRQLSTSILINCYTMTNNIRMAITNTFATKPAMGLTISVSSMLHMSVINSTNDLLRSGIQMNGPLILPNATEIFVDNQTYSAFAINSNEDIPVSGDKLVHIEKNEKLVHAEPVAVPAPAPVQIVSAAPAPSPVINNNKIVSTKKDEPTLKIVQINNNTKPTPTNPAAAGTPTTPAAPGTPTTPAAAGTPTTTGTTPAAAGTRGGPIKHYTKGSIGLDIDDMDEDEISLINNKGIAAAE